MPPVFGPLSSSKMRLWSWAVPIGSARVAVAQHEEGDLGTREALLYNQPLACRTEPSRGHRGGDGLFSLGQILRDHDALSGGQAVSLQHHRETERTSPARPPAQRQPTQRYGSGRSARRAWP